MSQALKPSNMLGKDVCFEFWRTCAAGESMFEALDFDRCEPGGQILLNIC